MNTSTLVNMQALAKLLIYIFSPLLGFISFY